MATHPHIIRQQHLHVEFNGRETDALLWQNKMSDMCQHKLIPAIERALDSCVPEAEHWLLDKLEINVGEVNLPNMAEELPQRVAQAIIESLQAYRRNSPKTLAIANASTDDCWQQTTGQHALQALLYFLRHGNLPWTFRLSAGKNLEQTLLEHWQQQSLDFSVLTAQLGMAQARIRLINQFSGQFLSILWQHIAPNSTFSIEDFRQPLAQTGLSVIDCQVFIKHLWYSAFTAISSNSHVTESQLIQTACLNLPTALKQSGALAMAVQQLWPDIITADNPALSLDAFTPLPTNMQAKQPLFTEQRLANSPKYAQGKNYNRRFSDKTASENQPAYPHPDAQTGIYLDNAGLVLLHPFLPRFFEVLGLVSEDKLTQPDRALHLLHYLVTGQNTAPEYELALPKLLCNLPLTSAISSDITLTDSETEEANALLQAVIRHWDVLKNTGIDGLRGTFLLRAGKIQCRDDGDWQLQVENQSFDFLLEQLPWGISVIKLPWMQRMLWVDWHH